MTSLHKLKLETLTKSFNVKKVSEKRLRLLSGMELKKKKSGWFHYYEDSSCLMFVIDSTDKKEYEGQKKSFIIFQSSFERNCQIMSDIII